MFYTVYVQKCTVYLQKYTVYLHCVFAILKQYANCTQCEKYLRYTLYTEVEYFLG